MAQHVVGGLENSELQPRRNEILLKVALDLVLHEIGNDRVQHRAEDEMPHASRAGSVNGGEAHVPFLGMQGRSNIVDLLHAVHGLGKHGRIGTCLRR